MKVLCTVPGKFGDILWALATVRQVSRVLETRVDFACSLDFHTLLPLVAEQDYIERVWALGPEDWPVRYEAPMEPVAPTTFFGKPAVDQYDLVLHLGLQGWPRVPLFAQFYRNAIMQLPAGLAALLTVRTEPPDEPWITGQVLGTSPYRAWPWTPDGSWWVFYGIARGWIELKMGVLGSLVDTETFRFYVPHAPGDRHGAWQTVLAGCPRVALCSHTWLRTAHRAASCEVYVGCLSSQWVLANALSKPCIVFDPEEARHQAVFWREHPRNRKVLGGDGKPTFDARHVAEALEEWRSSR